MCTPENLGTALLYQNLQEQFAAVSSESEKNLQKFQSLRIEFDELMLKFSESNRQIEDLHRTKSLLESKLSGKDYQITELSVSEKTNKDLIAVLQNEVKSSCEREYNFQCEVKRLNERIDCLNAERGNYTDLTSENEKLRAELGVLKNTLFFLQNMEQLDIEYQIVEP